MERIVTKKKSMKVVAGGAALTEKDCSVQWRYTSWRTSEKMTQCWWAWDP